MSLEYNDRVYTTIFFSYFTEIQRDKYIEESVEKTYTVLQKEYRILIQFSGSSLVSSGNFRHDLSLCGEC